MESYTSLELTVLSCRHLKAFNFFQKLSVYAAVSISLGSNSEKHGDISLQRQKTPADGNGGGNPEWKHTMRFDLRVLRDDTSPSSDHFLKFDIRVEGTVCGNRTIGKVMIPLRNLVEEFDGKVRFASYQVSSCDGKPNGVLSFSYKFTGTTKRGKTNGEEIVKKEFVKKEDEVGPSEEMRSVIDSFSTVKYPSLKDLTSPSPPIIGSIYDPTWQYQPPFDASQVQGGGIYYYQPDCYYSPGVPVDGQLAPPVFGHQYPAGTMGAYHYY